MVSENVKENLIDTKEGKNLKEQIVMNYVSKLQNPFRLLTVAEVSKDLHIGINQAYELFKQDDFPTVTIGKRKTISLTSYLLWKINKKGV